VKKNKKGKWLSGKSRFKWEICKFSDPTYIGIFSVQKISKKNTNRLKKKKSDFYFLKVIF